MTEEKNPQDPLRGINIDDLVSGAQHYLRVTPPTNTPINRRAALANTLAAGTLTAVATIGGNKTEPTVPKPQVVAQPKAQETPPPSPTQAPAKPTPSPEVKPGELREVFLKKGFGISLTEPGTLSYALELGADRVRIDLLDATPQTLQAYKKDIDDAIKGGIRLNFLIHPKTLGSASGVTDRLDNLFTVTGNYTNIAIELGAEPDNPQNWQNGDLSAFGDYAKTSIDFIRSKKGKDVQIIITPLSNVGKTIDLLEELEKRDINLRDLYFALYGKDNQKDLYNRLSELQGPLARKNVSYPFEVTVATQISVDARNVASLIPMVDSLRTQFAIPIQEAYVRMGPELLNHPANTTRFEKTPFFIQIQQYTQSLPKQEGEKRYTIATKTVI